MTKKQYLNSLRYRLCFKLSSEELMEITDDMEECFEAGIAEGKSEEEICESLGSPKSAAAELSAGRKILFSAAVRPAICIILTLILHYFALSTFWEPFILLIFLPPLFLFICESPKNAAMAIRSYPVEILPFISAMILPVGGFLLNLFVKFGFADRITSSAIYSAAGFIIITILSLTLLIFYCVKCRNFVVAVLAGAAFVFSAVTLMRIMNASEKYPESLGIAKALFYILPVSALCIVLLSVTDKNASGTASLYPALFSLAFADKLRIVVSRIDPQDTRFDFFKAISYHIYLIAGLLLGASALAAMLILRRKRTAANG